MGKEHNLINIVKKIQNDCFTTITPTLTIRHTSKTVASDEKAVNCATNELNLARMMLILESKHAPPF